MTKGSAGAFNEPNPKLHSQQVIHIQVLHSANEPRGPRGSIQKRLNERHVHLEKYKSPTAQADTPLCSLTATGPEVDGAHSAFAREQRRHGQGLRQLAPQRGVARVGPQGGRLDVGDGREGARLGPTPGMAVRPGSVSSGLTKHLWEGGGIPDWGSRGLAPEKSRFQNQTRAYSYGSVTF